MLRIIVLISIFLMFFTCTAAQADALIVPGVRINGAFMAQPLEVVVKAWGEPDTKESRGDDVLVLMNKRYNSIFYVQEGRLVGVETFSDRFKTESGLKVGSYRQEVVSTLGAPIDQENYSFTCVDGVTRDLYSFVYKGMGIGFSFHPDTHRVVSIFVFAVGKYNTIKHQ
jgi:hypothetical protein